MLKHICCWNIRKQPAKLDQQWYRRQPEDRQMLDIIWPEPGLHLSLELPPQMFRFHFPVAIFSITDTAVVEAQLNGPGIRGTAFRNQCSSCFLEGERRVVFTDT